MNSDDYQKAWQSTAAQPQMTVDFGALLKFLQQNQRSMQAEMLFDETSTVGTLLLLVPIWVYLGLTTGSPWTWYLMVPAMMGSIGFLLFARRVQNESHPEPGDSLVQCTRESLNMIDHQIWLQRNQLWWYELPMAIPIFIAMVHIAYLKTGNWGEALFDVNAAVLVLFVAIFVMLHFITQRVLQTHYEPKRRELDELLATLTEEPSGEDSTDKNLEDLPILSRPACVPPRWAVFVYWAIMVAVCLGIVYATDVASRRAAEPIREGEFAKLSPFSAVRWNENRPEVEINEQWYRLIALNDIPVEEILAFSRTTYESRWQMRFEEDLVELLSRMGRPPAKTVSLTVQSFPSGEVQTMKKVPMTHANRTAIKTAAEQRKQEN
ncbi:hypothetical protein [Rubinisphaera margarita]|uniref:hypothetical protein n=1 Tax=Rubinisphaera margarita TaxID=2909586 RepID=UPI001EE80494|nr:hypothetical protein [Rubinisphaera margarita]MCG6157525.1 hypothetical protein [Rubinisphaera margarita]